MKLINTEHSIIFSKATSTVDIHLEKSNELLNIILPSNHILVLTPDGELTVYDHTDTQLSTHILLGVQDDIY